MNFLEVLRSEKPFRLRGKKQWVLRGILGNGCGVLDGESWMTAEYFFSAVSFTTTDVLSEDWEYWWNFGRGDHETD